mmetsp:Transcript_16463/g.23071  ORF Transcript_16463/g.23071 Transcript_16463/m.23071 type:complete len:97 (+) Transcript_16463:274-564(+)
MLKNMDIYTYINSSNVPRAPSLRGLLGSVPHMIKNRRVALLAAPASATARCSLVTGGRCDRRGTVEQAEVHASIPDNLEVVLHPRLTHHRGGVSTD